ncbi:MAG: tRNA glutamyl-Q(34) synthetase GluQRS [Pseudomonadales bacterium]
MPRQSTANYVGRFAPSPTGPLHMGSLLAALASWLDARANNGKWLLRIEDLDPPREVAGSADCIIRSLDRHGLHWDGEICWQSQRNTAYEVALQSLQAQDNLYRCHCSRAKIGQAVYPGYCRDEFIDPSEPHSLRLKTTPTDILFDDLIQGHQQQNIARDAGDFILRRKDNYYAYQLAVVVDDADSGVNHILRGMDLIDSTARQIYLQHLLGYPEVMYAHFPLILNTQQQKLSKQTHATGINDAEATGNLRQALRLLGQASPPVKLNAVGDILQWAKTYWDISLIPAGQSFETPFPA